MSDMNVTGVNIPNKIVYSKTIECVGGSYSWRTRNCSKAASQFMNVEVNTMLKNPECKLHEIGKGMWTMNVVCQGEPRFDPDMETTLKNIYDGLFGLFGVGQNTEDRWDECVGRSGMSEF